MNKDRKSKVLEACSMIEQGDDLEAELTSLVAQSMQIGYDMAKMASNSQSED
jgi:hypothetical protein